MSGGEVNEAGAGASAVAFCETLSILLGNPPFTVYALLQIRGKENPEEVVNSFSALCGAHVDEEERVAFSALVNVAFKLARSGNNLKPEELAKDPAIWNRLTLEFGVRAEDVSALTKMSGKGGKEAAAGASPAAFCKSFSNLLGNPPFTVYALAQIPGKETPEEVVKSFSALYEAHLDEEERLAFSALVNVAFKLACSGNNLKPEDLAKDPAIWNRLTLEFGVRAEDVDLLQGYAESKQTVRESDQCREKAEMEWAHTSFTDYAFLGNAHKHLHEQLKERCMAASIANYYSPYVAVVQASGVGKSRAVMQLSELGVYICYCSLAGQFSSASPPRTGKLAERLSTTHDEYEMVVYFKAWLRVLSDSIRDGVTANAWKEHQLPSKNGSPRGDVAQRVLTVWEKLVSEEKPTNYRNTQPRDKLNISICEPEVTAIKSVPEIKDPCTVLFVFDEARGLQTEDSETGLMNSPFNQVRRALRLFFGEKVFFAVFLDTAARVSNPLPNKKNEDSARALKLNVRLLEPIYCLPNMAHCQPTPGLTAQEYWDPEKWLLYGRPLWGARWKYDSTGTSLLGLAEQKLLVTTLGQFGGEKVDVREGIMTLSQAIALLSAAAGLSICARSFLAEKLAASHMNLILRVTDVMEQRRVYVGLAAEPILAEAAGNVLSAAKVQEAALVHLDKAYLAGHVTPGPQGEFVTKFILVAAVWKLNHDGWLLKPIPVEKYLETLLGRLSCECPKNGVVFFNSFVIIHRAPTIADLGKAHASGYAFMYMAENRRPGADIIIPVWTPEGMTAIVVSAKNLQKAGWLKIESVDKVKSGYTHVAVTKGLSCITLLMSLREPETKNKTNLVQWNCKGDYIHLSCYGIEENYSFLDKNVKTLLKKLLVTVPDELGDATDKEKRCIKSMLPAQYAVVDEAFSQIPSAEGVMSTKRKGNTDQPEGVARKQRKVG